METKVKTEKEQRKLANLIPFKKGQSGNPNGAPRRPHLRTVIKKYGLLEKEPTFKVVDEPLVPVLDDIVITALVQASNGDKDARNFIFNYLEGKPIERKEFTGKNGVPLFASEAEEKAATLQRIAERRAHAIAREAQERGDSIKEETETILSATKNQ